PIQVVGVPIYRNDEQETSVMETINNILRDLNAAGIRTHLDNRDQTPGFKFNDWEMRGVPVRLEIGPRDVEKGNAVLVRRDVEGKAGKQFVSQDNLAETVQNLLDEIQANLLQQATDFRDENIIDVTSYDDFKDVIANNQWARVSWNENSELEKQIKDETTATLRCYPNEQPDEIGANLMTGEQGEQIALFAKAY
ncbi:MAG: His/Gly/Thr/Pro-type tRNA ligase C-terminal domain-containing protein, partial [Chloroflexota bacterium]